MNPENLKYSKEHEWVKVEGNVATIGITHYAQDSLGDVVYVDIPKVGKEFTSMQEFGVVESVKSVSSLYSPVSGKVIAHNIELAAHPEIINKDPYDQGWIIKLEMANPSELNSLLSSSDYEALLKSGH
ncbi:MAG: glycine cleavage system protein GcvH [Candidatus Margulisiibacteriota bacterium]